LDVKKSINIYCEKYANIWTLENIHLNVPLGPFCQISKYATVSKDISYRM